MANVLFKKGTAEAYKNLSSKDVNTFYYTSDDNNLYLGNIKLSNAADLSAALIRIAANETHIGDVTALTTTQKASLVAAINELKSEVAALTGGESGGISDMIAAVTGDLKTLTTDEKGTLVAAINELDAALDAEKTASKVTVTETSDANYAKVYTVAQGGTTVGTINIPKDMVVSAASIETDPEGQEAGTYIVLTISNATNDKLYINVGTLVDIYTAQANATQVQVAIDQSTNTISASIVAGSITATELAENAVTTTKLADNAVEEGKIADNAITTGKIKDKNVTKAKLADEIITSLDNADNAVKSVTVDTTEGAQGTILVDGAQVAVAGLGSAAYTEANAYDTAGSASSALADAKAYTDQCLTWGTIE